MSISLSILEYEPELSKSINNLRENRAFTNIMKLVRTGRIGSVHIDVMRPPLIPDKIRFSEDLIKKLYEELIRETRLNIHLMTNDPLNLINRANEFVVDNDRAKITIIVHVESFSTEDDAINAIDAIKKYGYETGVGLNLLTPEERLTEGIAEKADTILVMGVPMGLGGQKYYGETTDRLRRISKRFPKKVIEVDGGINPETIIEAWKAGARVAVVGSYITLSDNPIEALLRIDDILRLLKN